MAKGKKNMNADSISDIVTPKVLTAASYSASATTAAGGVFTVNDLALWLGIFLAVLTFFVNWIYQAFKDRRDAARHALETQILHAQLKNVEHPHGPYPNARDRTCSLK
ncbi:MAG: holin [Shewanella sp.]